MLGATRGGGGGCGGSAERTTSTGCGAGGSGHGGGFSSGGGGGGDGYNGDSDQSCGDFPHLCLLEFLTKGVGRSAVRASNGNISIQIYMHPNTYSKENILIMHTKINMHIIIYTGTHPNHTCIYSITVRPCTQTLLHTVHLNVPDTTPFGTV